MSFWEQVFFDTSALSLAEYLQIGFKIFLSFIAGFILGLERKIRQQAIGVRTVILISISSTLLMLLSLHMGKTYGGDSARLAAQVVSGIGFLGGGAILRQGLNIKGLTSAATIWAASAIGLTIGAGMYGASIIVLIVLILALIILEKFETKYFPAERNKRLFLVFHNSKIDLEKLHSIIEKHGLIILSSDISKQINEKQLQITFSVKSPEEIDIFDLSDKIEELGNLEEINLSD
jgi:putative Mg2+ transporter-C (MgtC) family protein